MLKTHPPLQFPPIIQINLLTARHHQLSNLINLPGPALAPFRKHQIIANLGLILKTLTRSIPKPHHAHGRSLPQDLPLAHRQHILRLGLHPHNLVDHVEAPPVQQVVA